LLVLPFWVWASHKTDKRKAYITGMFFFMAVMTVLVFIDPSLGFPVVISLAALAGVGISAVHVLTWAMIPDAVEVDELESGARHEGMFYALVTLFRKMASSVAIPLTLLVLDLSGFISNASAQPVSAVWAIRILIGPVPSILLLCGILFARFYPLSREVHSATREQIAARQSAAD
jgi:GPH family glycoside/pentoside/hexuronide:cation symporter